MESAEVFFGQTHDLVRRRIADDDHDRVVRRVIGVEELLHVLNRRGLNVRQVAVEVVGVEPVRVRALRQPEPFERAVRLVQHVDAHLFADDVLLVLQILGRDLQRTHAVRLEPHRELERVGRHQLEVVRVIEPRRPVQRAAVLVDDADVLELVDVLGALKHQVLEQMGEPGAIPRLDAEADPVHHFHRHHGRRMVLADHHTQAVRQFAVDDWNAERRARSRQGRPRRRLRGRHAGRERREADGQNADAHEAGIYHTAFRR